MQIGLPDRRRDGGLRFLIAGIVHEPSLTGIPHTRGVSTGVLPSRCSATIARDEHVQRERGFRC
jgi:hypothetical protein